jgi:hypothetical protein
MMSLFYIDDHGQTYVRHGIRTVQSPPSGWFEGIDLIAHVFDECQFDLGWIPIEYLFDRYSVVGVPEKIRIGGYKPFTIPYDGTVDYRRYGGFMSALAMALRVVEGKPTFLFSPGNEHETFHAQRHGTLGPRVNVVDWFTFANHESVSIDGVFGGHLGLRVADRSDYAPWISTVTRTTVNGPDEYIVGQNTGSDALPYRRASDVLEDLRSLWALVPGPSELSPWEHHIGGADWSYVQYYDLVVPEKLEYPFVVQYSIYWSYLGSVFDPKFSWLADVKLTISHNGVKPFPTDHFPMDTELDANDSFSKTTLTITREETIVNEGGWGGHYPGAPDVGVTVTTSSHSDYQCILSLAVKDDGATEPDLVSMMDYRKRPAFDQFRKLVELAEADIRLSAFQSTSDALDAITDSVDNNLVEAIGELGELASLFPGFGGLFRALEPFVQGRKLDTFLEFVNLATELRLLQKFGWEPTIQLFVDTMPAMVRVANRLGRLADGREIVGRGTFRWDFPEGEFGRSTSRLTTHTKVACTGDTRQILASILGARAMGLLPSFSASWDLIPFSFVVDWFVNVGARLRDLESVALISAMGVKVLTHSFTVESEWTDGELALDNAQKSNVSESLSPVFRVYRREVSQHVPTPRDGKYDFRLPSRPPNWMTSGSLIWQLAKGL